MKPWYALILAVLFACQLGAADNKSSSPAASGYGRISDSDIQQNIVTKLSKSKIGKDGFKVHVKGGVAYWEGHTGVVQHKGAATRMAKSSGAVRVENNIHVDGAGFGQPPRKAEVKTN